MTFIAQEELPTFLIARFSLRKVLNFNNTWPRPVKHSSVAQLVSHGPQVEKALSKVRNCAVPPDHLRNEISFLRTCNTANLNVKSQSATNQD